MQQKNLRYSLLQKEKPKHQNNDLISLEWISSNKPFFGNVNKKILEKLLNKILKIKPWDYFVSEFYLNKEVLNCIHGRNHSIRVAINLLFLGFQNKIPNDISLNDLIYSGLFHDCSRINDNNDLGHGEKSAIIFLSNLEKEKIQVKNKSAIYSAIKFHDLDYKYFCNLKEYNKNKYLCDLLKTADSLDRYRFPRDDWWIDEKYLMILPNNITKNFAFDLCYLTEKQKLINGEADFEEIIQRIKN